MGKPISQEQVSHMFNAISKRYDRANRLISLGIDRKWRRKLLDHIEGTGLRLLDCATGTCDQLLSLMDSGKFDSAIGVDLAEGMLELGKQKIARSRHQDHVKLIAADVMDMPLTGDQFDCVTMTFGVRNVQGNCLPELFRILKPGGKVLILEFSLPNNRFVRALHLLYLRHFLPLLGGLVSANFGAYRYLNRTIESFPCGQAFLKKMGQAGFETLKATPLSFGVATLYQGVKP